MAVKWEKVKGQKGLEFRSYGSEKSYRFRQYPYGADALGVTSLEEAIRISGELRANRATGAGPQSFKEMLGEVAEVEKADYIKDKTERKRIIADNHFQEANTVGNFWDRVYWPQRSERGSEHNNKSTLGLFNNWIRPVLSEIPLTELKFTHVEAMQKIMQEKGKSGKTIKNVYTTLQAMWTYAQAYLSAHNNVNLPIFPGKILPKAKINNEKVCWIDHKEAEILLDTLYSWHDIRKAQGKVIKSRDTKDTYGMTLLSLFSGLRFGDIAALRWQDVETGFAYTEKSKNGMSHMLHIDTDKIQKMLEERKVLFPDRQPQDYVFVSAKGVKWREVPQAFEDVIKHLGFKEIPRRKDKPLEKIDFHAMRHTFASWLAQAGVDLHTIMVLMGHKSLTMTLRYARLNPNYTKKHIADLEKQFNENIKK